MTLMRFDPFRDLDRFGERMFGGPAMRTMPAEAYRRGDTFYVLIDVPGVSPDDVDVTVERNVVSVQAARRSSRQDGDEVLVDERPHGEMRRQFFLGDNLDAAKLAAGLDRGVLTLTIPVAEQSKPRRVEVSASPARNVDVSTSESNRTAEPARA